MELSILLLAVTGLVLIDKAKNSEGQLVPIYTAEDEPDLVKDDTYDQKDSLFTPQELKDVYDLAKNISHSKGHITQSEEIEPEYRRSYVRKVITEAKYETLRLWFAEHGNSSDEYSVSDLRELEHLVHQYETAIDFIKLGGIEFLLPLLNHADLAISSAAFSVLTAAMQGNPTVQKHAENAQILDYILKALRSTHHRRSTSSLYALSSYIRNNPVSQLNFFRHNGLNILAGILKSQVDSLKSKLKVLELLSDLAAEVYMGPVETFENRQQLSKVKRAFVSGFLKLNLCEVIPNYLDYDDFVILEKTISAMNSVAPNVCLKDFKKPRVIKVVKQLLHKYEPKKFWLTKRESELRWIIWTELEALYDTIRMLKRW